jgi:hypothetical protein
MIMPVGMLSKLTAADKHAFGIYQPPLDQPTMSKATKQLAGCCAHTVPKSENTFFAHFFAQL